MKKCRKTSCFNMIEVVLAMAVIAFGMIGVLTLFPVGLTSSRTAIGQNYAADAVEQLVGYLKGMAELNNTNYDNLFVNAGCLPNAADVDRDETNIRTVSGQFLIAYSTGEIGESTKDFPRIAPGWNVFITKSEYATLSSSGQLPPRFFVVQGVNADVDGNVPRRVDFSAMILVWRSPVSTFLATEAGGDWEEWPASDSYANFAGLNAEISWPLEVPYDERSKRYFHMVVSRP